MHVLVTGGTRYLGSAIVRALARHGHAPVVFARHATSASLPGRAVDGDVRDRSALARAAAGVGAICHTAALVSVSRPRPAEFDEINASEGSKRSSRSPALSACHASSTRRRFLRVHPRAFSFSSPST
jgi:uncharacterized protein YbjT (DUF2867 family)